MKRRLFKLALFLILGAIVNVAVAWGCAKWFDWIEMITLRPTLTNTFDPAAWRLDNLPKSWPDKPSFALTRRTGWFLFTDQMKYLDDEGAFILHDFRFGVPSKSLTCYKLLVSQKSRWTTSWRYANSRLGGDYPLPLHPIWPGFAFNTIFYATILWLLTLAPFTARRLIRRKRGLCIKCGYDLCGTEHYACPECGKELIAKVKP